jgi:hypothetical protein
VSNGSSNLGAVSCDCNGESGTQATVSATVTNTGKVTGSDVAQLYLDDPTSTGEPPRQLKGYQKVTLKPGQSTTVHFKLSGQDLSYWNDAADGWVVPDGRFGVSVGDSSAVANLPLRGGFTVARSVGARYATVGAPAAVTPGVPATVTATVVNDGDYPMPNAQFNLQVPKGWTVSRTAPVTVRPGQTVTRGFTVTPPANAQPGNETLTARITSRTGPFGQRAGLVEASATVPVAATSLATVYDNTGVSNDSDPSAADYDGVGDSFSAQALAAGIPTPLTKGGRVTVGGTTFTWPDAAPGRPDNVVAAGQTVNLSGSGTDLGFLASSQNGTATGAVTVNYKDGTSQSFNLNVPDWYSNAPAVGDQTLTTTSSWNYTSTTQSAHPVSVYFSSVPLKQGEAVSSVTLPTLENSGGTTAMHIFSMAVGSGTPTVGAPYSSAAAAYDNVGISDDSDPAVADFDGTGESFSAQALAAGTPTPLTSGAQTTIGGTTFTWPAAGGNDNIIVDGQIIDLSGSGSDLGFLGASAFGSATGTGTITYTDGTTQSFGLGLADWYNNSAVAGSQIASTTTAWNYSSTTQTPHPVSIYFASVPLTAGKTVASVTLPTVGSGAGDNENAMHIFAMAIGSGTPTATN